MSVLKTKEQELPIVEGYKLEDFIHSSLFNEVYIYNDLPVDFENVWKNIDPSDFYYFYEQLSVVLNSFNQKEALKWSHEETLENLIFPMLNILGYGDIESKNNSLIVNSNLNIIDKDLNNISVKPSIMYCEDEAGKNYILSANPQNTEKELRKYLKQIFITSYYGATWDRRANKFDQLKDEIGKRGDVYSSFGPDLQATKYLELFNSKWMIYTDGYTWRLYRKEISEEDANKYFEFDLVELQNALRTSNGDIEENSIIHEAAKYFYWFFSNEALHGKNRVVPFVESVWDTSQKYIDDLEEDLQERFVHAMTVSCNGYLRSEKNINFKDKDTLKLLSKTSESLIFNLIFVRSCEARRILPIHQEYINVSLKLLVESLKYYNPYNDNGYTSKLINTALKKVFGEKVSDNGYEVYGYIKKLFQIVEKGENGFGIKGFLKSVFTGKEKKFYNEHKISNVDMIKLLHKVFYTFENGKCIQVPYNLITARQLGSIYESFLEFQPVVAPSNMIYKKRKKGDSHVWKWEETEGLESINSGFYVKKGELIFSPDNDERETTGSYYTPDNMVDYIVSQTLAPVIKGKTKKEILKLSIIDPAMGSGHFLLGALDFLSKKIVESNPSENYELIRREVLHSCLYGVDLNKSAVKLGKMSLWLVTAMAGNDLEELDDQLKDGNSIQVGFKWKKKFPEVFKNGGFDSIVGNPPWGASSFTYSDLPVQIRETVDIKNLNIFEIFCRQGINILNKTGTFGFLIPRNVIRKDVYANLRKDVLPYLVEVSDAGKFPGVTQEACAIIVSRETEKDEDYHIYFNDVLKVGHEKAVKNSVERNSIEAPKFLFQINKSNKYEKVVSKMQSHKKIDDFFGVTRGIECGKKGEFVICEECETYNTPPKKKNKDGENKKNCKSCGHEITLEDSYIEIIQDRRQPGWQQVLIGPDVTPFKIDKKRYMKKGCKGISYKEKYFKPGPKLYVPMNNYKIVAALDKNGNSYV